MRADKGLSFRRHAVHGYQMMQAIRVAAEQESLLGMAETRHGFHQRIQHCL